MGELPKVETRSRAHDTIQSLLELDQATLDPGMHYRWVADRPRSVGNAKIRGYNFVPNDGRVKTRAGYLDDPDGGYMRIQDTILMACPLDEWRARKKGQLKQANSRLSAPKKQFKKNARSRKVRILNEEDE